MTAMKPVYLFIILLLCCSSMAQDAVPWEQFDLTAKILPQLPPEPKSKWHKQGWGASLQWQTGGVFNKPDDGFLLGGGIPDLIKTYFAQNPERNEVWVEYFEGLWGVEPNEVRTATSTNWWNSGRLSLEMPPFLALHVSGGAGRQQTVTGNARARVFPFEDPTGQYLVELPLAYRLRSYAIQVGLEARPGSHRIQGVLGGGYHFQRTTQEGDLQLSYQLLSEVIPMIRSANIHGGFIDAGLRAYLYKGFFIQPLLSILIFAYHGDNAFLSMNDKSPEVQLSCRVGIGYHIRKGK